MSPPSLHPIRGISPEDGRSGFRAGREITLMPAESSRDLPPVLISEEEIGRRVDELAAQISLDYADAGEIILIGVLKGAFVFLADLARRLTIERRIEFIALSSYPYGAKSGAVRLLMDVRTDVRGRHVLIVEDIVDTANTLHYLIDHHLIVCPPVHRTEYTHRRREIGWSNLTEKESQPLICLSLLHVR